MALTESMVTASSLKDFDIEDSVLLQASQEYEESLLRQASQHSVPNLDVGPVCKKMRFAKPVSDDEIKQQISRSIPKATKKNTMWAVRIWNEWAESRIEAVPGEEMPMPLDGSDYVYNRSS